jgi:hypothetical protein
LLSNYLLVQYKALVWNKEGNNGAGRELKRKALAN